jgi:hypothetical protein
MLYKSQVYTEASGSIGGITYSHNRGGAYTRGRTIPTNPNSVQQQVVRGLVTQLSNLWVGTLTGPERAAWDLYAANVTLPNRLGEQVNIGGLAHYVRSNVPRLQAALGRIDAAPTTFNLGAYTVPVIVDADASDTNTDLTTGLTDEWWTAADSALLLYTSRPQNPSINYFKGPYRFGGKQVGGGIAANPVTLALGFPVAAGQRVFMRWNVTLADGRLSTPSYGTVLAIA